MAFRHRCNPAAADEQGTAPGVADRPELARRPRRSAAVLMASAIAIRKARRSMRHRVNLAPDPAITTEPVIQVYGARCMGWRGYLSLHTWIAVKPAAAKAYTVYEVTPEALSRRGCCVATHKRPPDAYWYGAAPQLLGEKRGDDVGPLIERILAAIKDYRYAGKYVMWPGPNSNTFIAHLARVVPELELELPCHAIGKDYLGVRSVGRAASGTGFQISLFGLLGIMVSRVEGFEINVLGLSCGINPFNLCIKLPLVGHLGAARIVAAVDQPAVPDASEAAD
jgi:Protein of unknown function (DUF3750)